MKKTWATLGVHRKPQFGIAVNVVALDNRSFSGCLCELRRITRWR